MLTTYYCAQIFSSYAVHDRLVFYMRSNFSRSILLWEQFCEFDRTQKDTSAVGGRKQFFILLNKYTALGTCVHNVVELLLVHEEYVIDNKYQFMPICNLLLILVLSSIAVVWALKVNRAYSKGDYNLEMKDTIARCGYIDSKRRDLSSRSKAVFLDRDGTVIVDKVETRRIEDLEFFEDIKSLKGLMDEGFLLVVVTNQSGIGKGHYSEEEMMTFNDYMVLKLKEQGIIIDALYYCPHTNEDNCQCKKPKDGMLRRAALDLNIDLAESFIIGDQNSDMKAGINSRSKKCIIVPTGLYPRNKSGKYEIEPLIKEEVVLCENLRLAVNEVLSTE